MALGKSLALAEIRPADPVPVMDRQTGAASSRRQRRAAGQRSDKTERGMRTVAYWTAKAEARERAYPDKAAEAQARHVRRIFRSGRMHKQVIVPNGFGFKAYRAAQEAQLPPIPAREPRPQVTPMDPYDRMAGYVRQNGTVELTGRQLRAVRKAQRRALAAYRKVAGRG